MKTDASTSAWKRRLRSVFGCVSHGKGGLLAVLMTAAACAVTSFAIWRFTQIPSGWSVHWSADDEYTEDNSLHRARLALGAQLAPGLAGRAVKFDGAEATVVLEDWAPQERWTLSFWTRPAALMPGIRLIAGSPPEAIPFGIVLSNGFFSVSLPASNGTRRILSSLVAAETNRWYHIAATSDSGITRLFVNGRLRAESPASPYAPSKSDTGIYLGNWHGPPKDSGFAGLLDDIWIYPRPLTGPEIRILGRNVRGVSFFGWHCAIVLGSFSAALAFSALLVILGRAFLFEPNSEPAHDRWANPPWIWFVPIIVVLIVGFTAGIVSVFELRRRQEDRNQSHFRAKADEFLQQFDARTENYVQTLRSLRVGFNAQTTMNQFLWNRLTSSLQYPSDYPGLHAVGFAPLVRPNELASFEAWAKAAVDDSYTIHPRLPEPERIPLCEIFDDCAAARLPVTFNAYHFGLTDVQNQNETDWGYDLLGLKRSTLDKDEPVYDSLGFSLRDGSAIATLPGVIDPGFGDRPETVGTRVLLATDKPVGIFSGATNSAKSKKNIPRSPGIIYGSFDWQEFFHSALKGQKLEMGFEMSGPNYTKSVPLARSDRIDASGTPYRQGLRAKYKIKFYHRVFYFDFFTTPAFYSPAEQNWPWIIGFGIAGSTLGTGLLVGLQLSARWKETLNARLLRRSRDELQVLLQERQRLSRDLHDGTIQSIYAIGLGLKRCQKLIEQQPALALGQLSETVADVNSAIAELRQFVLSLEPDLPRGDTLRTALKSMLARLQRTTSATILLHIDPSTPEKLEPFRSIHILNIVRECVSNSARHAKPAHINVNLFHKDGRCQLEITDDGKGFDTMRVDGSGHGLQNLRSRAEDLNGIFQLSSLPDKGTSVVIQFSL